MEGWILWVVVMVLAYLGISWLRKYFRLNDETAEDKMAGRIADMMTSMEPVQKPEVKDFLDESNAKDISLQVFDDMFDAGRIIIEKETFGFTRDFGVWVGSDARLSVPRGATPAFQHVEDLDVGFATTESFMYEGTVFSKQTEKMFPDVESLREYAKTLFAIFLVYEGVSPIDRNTKRYYIVGCRESDGVVPTHGL